MQSRAASQLSIPVQISSLYQQFTTAVGAASQCSPGQLTRVVLGQAVAQLGVPSPNWGAERDAVNSTEAAETQNEVQTAV